MAKKSAVARKAPAKKSKAAVPSKSAKPLPAKLTKNKADKTKAPATKKIEKSKSKTAETKVSRSDNKPALMTTKGKKAPVEIEKSPEAKPLTVTHIVESEEPTAAEVAKVEKTSKVKAVRVERGNLADEKAKWADLYKKYGREKAIVYKMSDTYAPLTALQHKVLGWGFVLTNENNRIEVLFETGIRVLISNYKT